MSITPITVVLISSEVSAIVANVSPFLLDLALKDSVLFLLLLGLYDLVLVPFILVLI